MSVHQIRWNAAERDTLHFNTLACLQCEANCTHGYYLCQKKCASTNDGTQPMELPDVTQPLEPQVAESSKADVAELARNEIITSEKIEVDGIAADGRQIYIFNI